MDPRSNNRYFNQRLLKLKCYIDETGNTGLNHFDPSQINFMLGCAVSKKEFNEESKEEFKKIYELIGKNEIHASHLGAVEMGRISKKLINIVRREDLFFIFIDIEKQHYLSMMMFHHFYDPGLNKAATNIALAFKIQRLTLAYNFSLFVSLEDKRNYWGSVRDGNVEKYVQTLEKIKRKIKQSHLDFRSKELIGDALAYTVKYPQEIFDSMVFDELVAPNNSALGLLINSLQGVFDDKKVRIDSFLHDEQKQFGRFLQRQYQTTSSFFQPSSLAMDSMFDVKPNALFKETMLEFSSSCGSKGLQLIDAVLWVFKRFHFGRFDNSTFEFYEEIKKRSGVVGITYDMHVEELRSLQKDLYSKEVDFSFENLERSRELFDEIEKQRWKEK